MLKEVSDIPLGPGQILYAEYEEDGSYNEMKSFGMMKDCKILAERDFVTIEDQAGDGPLAEVKRDCIREKGQVEFVLGEDIPEENIVKFGAGTVETVAKQTGVEVGRIVTLMETSWEMLRVSKKANPSLSFTVQTADVTPEPYTEYDSETKTGDYILGEIEGSWAIRRAKTSSIPNNSRVEVLASGVVVPGYKKLSIGGDRTSKIFYMEHWKKMDDGDIKITELHKMGAAGKLEFNHPSDNYGNTTMVFGLQADPTRAPGDRLFSKRYEDSRIE